MAPTHLQIHPSILPSIHQSIHPSNHPTNHHPSIHFRFYLSVYYLRECLHICLSDCFRMSVCLSFTPCSSTSLLITRFPLQRFHRRPSIHRCISILSCAASASRPYSPWGSIHICTPITQFPFAPFLPLQPQLNYKKTPSYVHHYPHPVSGMCPRGWLTADP